ncbi:MAG: dihydropyrimidinase [Anaerolineae bacterium]
MAAEGQLLIRGGTVVTAETKVTADVLVEGEIIRAIGLDLPVPEHGEVVDADGLLVLPGVIDAHTHIQLDTGVYKTADTWLEGSRAAAYGGITTVVDFATQFEGQSFEEALSARLSETDSSVIDYALHMMVTDLPPGREEELGVLPELGIQSIKLYTTYRPNYYADDATLLRLMEVAARYSLITLVHCENDALVAAQTEALVKSGRIGWRYHGASRPLLAEQEAAARVLFLAEAAGAPVVIVHASTGLTSSMVAEARERGQVAFSETTPQYLLLDSSLYEGNEPWRYILQPPLRPSAETEALWSLVADGQVEMFVTDHCDYKKAQKLAVNNFTKTPGGLPGMETLLPLIATYGVAAGWIDWPDLVRMMAANPAQIYNLWPRKGALLPGSDADLVLFDPAYESVVSAEELHMVAGYSPYEGMRIKGRVVSTLRRGAFLVRDGTFVDEPSSGVFLKREARFWS